MGAQLDVASPRLGSSSQRTLRGPQLSVKRFGRNDFERFDQEAARGSQLCVGSQNIGKVEIDCKYHWKKAQWGVLGNDRRPAGIVYMDINFKQPTGYSLDVANVFITLAEDSKSYALSQSPSPADRRLANIYTDYAVQITDHYGPRLINGQKTAQQKMSATSLTPNLGAMGVSLGGLGYKSSTVKENFDAWCFRGSVGRPKNGNGLRTLHWELKENSLDQKQIHSQEYCTAFAFEHSHHPVFMRVEIDGTLSSKGRNLKHGFLRFSSRLGGKDNSTLTQMDFSYAQRYYKPLDHVAKDLDLAMQCENWKKSSVEMPAPKPAQFTDQDQSQHIENDGPTLGEALIEQALEEDDPVLEALARQIRSGRDARPSAVEDSPQPLLTTTVQSIQTTGPIIRPRSPQRSREPATRSRPPSRTPSHEQSGTTTSGSDQSSTTAVNSERTSPELHDDELKELMRMPPIIFIIIRFLISIGSLFGGQQVDSSKSRQIMADWDGSDMPDVQIKQEEMVFEEDHEHHGQEENQAEVNNCTDEDMEDEDVIETLARLAVSNRDTQGILGATSMSKLNTLPSRGSRRQPERVLKVGG